MANNPCGFIVHCYHSFQTFSAPSLDLSLSQWPKGSAGGLLRSPPPSASLTQLTPFPSLLKKERGDAKVVLFNCSPSLIHLERGN